MRLTIWSQLIFLFSLILILSSTQIGAASSKQDETTPTPSAGDEPTTKKSGLFGGIKKFFSRSKTTPAPDDQQATTTTTTTVKPTTALKSAAATITTTAKPTTTVKPTAKKLPVPPSGFGAGQAPPGFPQFKPQKPLPSGLELSYGGVPPPPPPPPGSPAVGSKIAATPTTTTTTTKPNANSPKIGNTPSSPTFATTKKPEDFPPLPSPKIPPGGAVTASTSPSTPTNVWTRSQGPQPGSVVGGPSNLPAHPNGGVSFVPHSSDTSGTTTVRPGFPTDKPLLATDDEIRQLTEDLYSKETASQINRIHVNLQGKTRSIDSTDEAPQPLLDIEEKAFETESITKMRALFNNYEMDAGVNEHVSPREREEEQEFVDSIATTTLMRHAMVFLQNKGVVTSDPKTHKDLLKELWFTQYSRLSGKVGSSGFEHVFVNEVKNGTIIGLHNWVYFYEQEKAGKLDYKGYLKSEDLGQKGKVVKVRFTHNGNNKPVNTLFIGTSPELEIALYTVCFKLRPDRTCPVSLGGKKIGIVTYSWRHRGKDLIGSAFPEI